MTAQRERDARLEHWRAVYRQRREEVETGVDLDGGIGVLDPAGVEHLCGLIVSIELDGYDEAQPVEFNQHGRIVEGRHRLAACHLLGIEAPRRIVRTYDDFPY